MNNPIESNVEAESLTAITGVVRPSPLAELRELLGVWVVDVERFDGSGGRSWLVTVARRGGQLQTVDARTFDFKNGTQLNWLLWRCGRPDDLPRLTRVDGHRALRLMHEIAESGAGGTVTTEADMRRDI